MIHLTVIAHGNGIAAFRRHKPLWEAHKPDLGLVLCPENDPVAQEESPWPVVRMAQAEHNGTESWKRLRWLLEYLARQENASHFLIYEYDSFSLSPVVQYRTGLIGNVFANQYPERFMAVRYANPPLMLDRGSVVALYRASVRCPDVIEEGECDRYLAALATLAGVPVLNFTPKGFSRGCIREEDIGALRESIYAGATMLHGIKQKWTLEAALQFYDERGIVKRA